MKTTIALAALAIATSTSATRADTLRTCRGPVEVCNRPHRDVGRCYAGDAASAAIIDAACEKDKPCVAPRLAYVPRNRLTAYLEISTS